MPTGDRGSVSEGIRRALFLRSGDGDARDIATATMNTWQLMVDSLAPIIGERGVDALLRRALHLSTTVHPWLGVPFERDSTGGEAATFKVRLAAQEASVALETSHAVLFAVTELLAGLIGESLSERLLAKVWATSPQKSSKDSSHER